MLLLSTTESSATTIAYDGEILACDSRITTTRKTADGRESNNKTDNAIKYMCVSNIIFCCTGDFEKFDWFILNYLQELLVEHPEDPNNVDYHIPRLKIDLNCSNDLEIMVIHKANPSVVEIWPALDSTNKFATILLPPVAIGSGASYALTAMKAGKTAVEAVEYAKEHDKFTGGFVHNDCLKEIFKKNITMNDLLQRLIQGQQMLMA